MPGCAVSAWPLPLLLPAFLSCSLASQQSDATSTAAPRAFAEEYDALWKTVEDKIGLEAIRALHEQLDDDNDGTIEPSETRDYIKVDLKPGLHESYSGNGDQNQYTESHDKPDTQYEADGRREKLFHKKDTEITVQDLWLTWSRSEVHNWTVEQTAEWLTNNVDLPQYKETFMKNRVTGNELPRAASDPNFLSKVLGINSSIHRSKISLKAMDVVLFGPPKEQSNLLKDVILTSLFLALLTALFWAWKTKKHSEEHLSKMMKDMESLAKAEKALQDMQNKLVVQEETINKVRVEEVEGGEEVGRLREEVEILRGELQRAEVELEDKCWMAPTVLQHWLQLTYELESQVYNTKRKAAEYQMEAAKDACDKLKKKRSSLVGAFVSTHGRSIDDVDKSILEAKTALMELTQDLSERSQRWRQIEMLTGVNIVTNPGLSSLQRLVRHVGGGRGVVRGGERLSSRMSSMSVDDLHDELETRSVAASYVSHASHLSSRQGGIASSHLVRRPGPGHASSREGSKESSNSESDEVGQTGAGGEEQRNARLVKQESRVSEASVSSGVSSMAELPGGPASPVRPADTRSLSGVAGLSPGRSRRSVLVKSQSQDGCGAAVTPTGSALHTSSSDSALHSQSLRVTLASQLSEVEESCSASDTGSITDLDGKKKKKKSFFNFRRKKDKAVS